MTDLERVELALRRAIHDRPCADVPEWLHEFVNELQYLSKHHRPGERDALDVLRNGGYA